MALSVIVTPSECKACAISARVTSPSQFRSRARKSSRLATRAVDIQQSNRLNERGRGAVVSSKRIARETETLSVLG